MSWINWNKNAIKCRRCQSIILNYPCPYCNATRYNKDDPRISEGYR